MPPPGQPQQPLQRTSLVFPSLGVNRNFLRSDQNQFQQGYLQQFQPQSCWAANNWWPYDTQYGRLRGGQRPAVVNLPGSPGGAGNIQGLIASAFTNPSSQLLLPDIGFYVDRLGVPQATWTTLGTVSTPGYTPLLESLITSPSTGQFFDVDSSAFAPAGASTPSWANYSSNTGTSIPGLYTLAPYAAATGNYLSGGVSQFASVTVDEGAVFMGLPAFGYGLVCDSLNNPLPLTSYAHPVMAHAVARINSMAYTSIFSTDYPGGIGLGAGYPPLTGTAGFETENAYTFFDVQGTTTNVFSVQTEMILNIGAPNPATPTNWFQPAAATLPSFSIPTCSTNYFTADFGMKISSGVPAGAPAGPTYTAQQFFSHVPEAGSALFAPANSSPFSLYSNGTNAIGISPFSVSGTAGGPAVVATGTLATISVLTNGTATWTTSNSSITNPIPGVTVTNIALTSTNVTTGKSSLTFVMSAPNGTHTFGAVVSGAGFQTMGATSGTLASTVTFSSGAFSFPNGGNTYALPVCLEYGVMDARIVRETFPYNSGFANTGLDTQSFSVWNSKTAAITPAGPISQFWGGSAAPTAFTVGAVQTGTGFCQGVTVNSVAWAGALMSTLATANICSGTFQAGLTFTVTPNTGTSGSNVGLIFAPSLPGNYSAYPAYSLEYSFDTGGMILQHWTVGSATSTAVIDQVIDPLPFFSGASVGVVSPVTIGLQNQGGTLTCIYNGTAIGNPVTATYDIGAQLVAGNVSAGFGTGIQASGPAVGILGLSILPAVEPSYTFGTGENQFLLAIVNGQVSIYAANEGNYMLAGPTSAVYFAATGAVNMAALDQFVYATDGINPVAVIDVATNAVNRLVAASGQVPPVGTGGSVPTGCNLIAEWRSRLVLALGTNLFFSRINAPTDWDYSQVDEATAVALPLQQQADLIGTIPSSSTALMPANNDVLVIGCVDSVWALVGDPGPSAGGQLVNVNRGSGVFGQQAWCRDDVGNLYWANNAGLFVWNGSSPPQNLSFNQYNQFFQAIDGTQNTVILEYDPKRWCIKIYVTPSNGTAGNHILYDLRNQGFWPFTFPAQCGPFAAVFMNGGNQTQRESILGGTLGQLYTFDTTSTYAAATCLDLGTTSIGGYMTMGPFHLTPPGMDCIVNTLDYTAGEIKPGDNTNSFGGSIVLSGGKSAYDVTEGTPYVQRTNTFSMDWNNPVTTRCRGGWFSCKIVAGPGQQASFEHAMLTWQPQGKQR